MKYASVASIHETRATHAAFHLQAADVVKAIERGDRGQAEAMLGTDTPYGLASEAVILALTKLRGEVRKEGSASPPS